MMKTIAAFNGGLELWRIFYPGNSPYPQREEQFCGLILIPFLRNLAVLRPLTCTFQTEVIKKLSRDRYLFFLVVLQ